MKNFDALLFLGNGDKSEEACRKLYRILDEALSISGGQQQGGATIASLAAVQEAVRDIAVALTGYSIEFKDKVPYPGTGLNYQDFKSYDDFQDGT